MITFRKCRIQFYLTPHQLQDRGARTGASSRVLWMLSVRGGGRGGSGTCIGEQLQKQDIIYIGIFVIIYIQSMAKSHPTNIAIGKNKGHKTTRIQAKQPRPVASKGRAGKRTKLIRQVISQVAGATGYEKRVIEFLKAGSLKDTKRALRATKKALGTHRRAKLKRENLMNLLRTQTKKK